ncbi:CS1 type fimbrial major subunit [Stenotrophomonas sp. YAU14A_MKIMI4_1]|uniref:CS1 type fimbrial major subunit n=1 Tax=Stenotrophomonas sp. YAU14A_MKIMI4_1 TaxID=2072408 RepID=UPI000D5415E7|nr:CS1 type fimbrial major subunit [Stenotrophomonas sp. YAU14A_MKIMI4_1]AWH29568.1 hypothetical protein C1931_11955 [Stenotrophomonas sp. YAU14A_MKIMI4_1]
MNISKTFLSTAAALILAPAVAIAAPIPVTVSVEATIPAAAGLQVTPVGGWDSITQRMSWDIARQDLQPISQQIDMKNSSGAINGYLVSDAALTSGANSLPLTVAVNGKTLPVGAAAAVELLTAAEAGASKRVGVNISTTRPGAGYVEGNYTGLVYMMFDAVAP